MAATTGQPDGQAAAPWALLLRPRWLAWHAFVVLSTVGMLLLGEWQLHRAEAGNELSWAYTFEWPLFAAFTVYFWIKSLRDELRQHAAAGAESQPGGASVVGASVDGASVAGASVAGASVAGTSGSGSAATAVAEPAAGQPARPRAAGAAAARADGSVEPAGAGGSGRRADSWDATSWDATSWAATGVQTGAGGASEPVDVSRATPADGEAYVARLTAEVQRSGRRGRR